MKIILIILLWFPTFLFGQDKKSTSISVLQEPVIIYADSVEELELLPSAIILNETNKRYSLDEIESGVFDSLFTKTLDQNKNDNTYYKSFWIKIYIKASTNKNTHWLLKTDKLLSEVTAYFADVNGIIDSQKSGWSVPPARRSVADPDIIFDLPLKQSQSIVAYLHVQTDLRWSSINHLKVTLIPETNWYRQKLKNYTFLSVYAGICLLALFYWLFTYLYSPKANYIYLIVATLSALIFCLDIYGVTTVIWSDYPFYLLVKYGQHYLWLPLMVVSHFAISYKANSFVSHFPKKVMQGYWMTCYITVALLLFTPLFMKWEYAHRASLLMILFSMAFGVILISYLLIKRGFRSTGFAFLAILPIFIGMGAYIFLSMGILSERYRVVTPIGALTTVIMYFYGMVYYVRALREKRNNEILKNDLLIREQNELLELTVEQRTAELKTTNHNLSVAIHDLKNTHAQLIRIEQSKTNEKINNLLKEQELRSVTDMLNIQESERKRIAADLHDRLGSMLSTVKLYFGSVEEQFDNFKEQNKDQFFKATSLLDEACDEVRKISHDLVSGELVKFGLVSALRQLAKTIEDTGQLQINVLEFGIDDRLESPVEISLYHLVQEMINNILKHSKATEVVIQLNKSNNDLNIMVEDNGIGFDIDAAKAKGGMGLANMITRVNKLNGKIHFDSGKGKGTTIIIEISV